MMGKAGDKELRFGAAMQELEAILRRVESEEIDIDELADELQRAAALLEICRSKIRRAEVEVSQIVQSLAESDADDSDSEPPAPAAEETATEAETASLFDGEDD